jgi:hypothetical protein
MSRKIKKTIGLAIVGFGVAVPMLHGSVTLALTPLNTCWNGCAETYRHSTNDCYILVAPIVRQKATLDSCLVGANDHFYACKERCLQKYGLPPRAD